jgi:uncharacterized protein (DUF58 family)
MIWRWALMLGVAALYMMVRPDAWPWVVLVALLALAIWVAYRIPPTIKVQRWLGPNLSETARTFAGQTVLVRLEVQMNAPLPVLLTIGENVPLTLIPNKYAALSGLFWGRSQHVLEYQVTPNTRGEFTWPEVNFNWNDPLGLAQRHAAIQSNAICLLVYPGLHALELPDLLRPLLNDGARARVFGLEDALTLRGVRDYAPGDEQRRIHWKQTARFGVHENRFNRLVVREYDRVAATGLRVHLDVSLGGRLGELYLESAVRLAASLLRSAFDEGLRVSVSNATKHTEGGSNFDALERALAMLATLELETPRLEPIEAHIPMPEPGSNLILITAHAPAPLIEAAIRARARAARVTVIAMPEGFYLEPGETGRPVHRLPPNEVQDLMRRAGVLEEAGVRVVVLRGDDSVIKLTL